MTEPTSAEGTIRSRRLARASEITPLRRDFVFHRCWTIGSRMEESVEKLTSVRERGDFSIKYQDP
jgi:hypothetical protein